MPTWFFLTALAVFGLCFGSFANVVIWRLPRKESLSYPASHCPSCESPIRGYDNIPVLSWLVLRARCRDCGTRISARYPAVELLSAVLWLSAGIAYGQTLRCAAAVILFYLLLILSAIDLDTMRLPNSLVAVLAVVGLAGAVASQLLSLPVVPLVSAGEGALSSPLASALLGAVGGVALTGGVAVAYRFVRGTQGFGMGDIKLLGVLGLFLGPYSLLALFFASMIGAVVGVIAARKSGSLKTKYPFGPYLAAGAIVCALVGPQIWTWYLGLFAV